MSMRIVFFGTPEFAALHLEALVNHAHKGWQVVGVVTAPDKRGGRGHELLQSAVKKVALAHNLPLLQPEKLKSPDFLEELRALQPDLNVVVAFRMMPEIVWNMPPMGSLNVHGSLLPFYRGAAPINWAIINGETKTGLTTFFLKHEIDTGDILLQTELEIGATEDFGSLYGRMAALGCELLVDTLAGVIDKTLVPYPQPELSPLDQYRAHAPKLHAETSILDFKSKAINLVNQIRGLSPAPAAHLIWEGERMKVYKAAALPMSVLESAGVTLAPAQVYVSKDQLWIGTLDGALQLLEIQVPGKKRMQVADWLLGVRQVPDFVS